MTRAQLLERIGRMSDNELDRVGPYLEADLDALDGFEGVEREIALGRESAREEPLMDHEAVMAAALERLAVRR